MSELIKLRDHFLKVLSDAQDEHRRKEDWVELEQQALLNAVNKELLAVRKDPITVAFLRRIEQPALGHSDYSSKFALYCAELVLGKKREKQ